MIHTLKKYFDKKIESITPEKKEDTQQRLKVAVCALLLETAHTDDEFSDDERSRLVDMIKTGFGLTGEEADELIHIAQEEREKSVDLWHFTKLINENYALEEKIHLMEMLWEIVYADSVLDRHEDYLMHTLTKLLKLEHRQMIAAKLKAKPD
jgi:uncharacterized tellurite resistance protein B-like protein